MANKQVNAKKGHQGFHTVPPHAPKIPSAAPVLPSSPASNIALTQPSRVINLKPKLDTTRPFPQANSLAKVASVVDAVSGCADTDEGIASAIGVVGRQGAYYANAAAYLGLLHEGGGSPRSWTLTAQGIDFLNASALDRTRILTELVAKIPAANATIEDTGTAETEVANSESLSDTTASRRVATLGSWINILTSTKAVDELTLEHDGVRERLPEAAKIAAEARNRIKNASAGSRPLTICDRCFTAKSVTGFCLCS